MSATAVEILEQFRKLSLPERRALVDMLAKEAGPAEFTPPRPRNLDEVLGKFPPKPEPQTKDLDWWYAEAILASKRGEG